MILKKLIVGALGTNCYVFGSSKTGEVIIIDPGGDSELIIETVEKLESRPIAVLLTHGHFDHSLKTGKIMKYFEIPLMYNRKEFDSGFFSKKEADKWLKERDTIKVGEITLHVLETPGHSPGSLSFYAKELTDTNGQDFSGIVFTGDLIFRRSVGRTDFAGGSQGLLFSSIREKIMHNPEISDDFIILSGHMGRTTVGEERNLNLFKSYFL